MNLEAALGIVPEPPAALTWIVSLIAIVGFWIQYRDSKSAVRRREKRRLGKEEAARQELVTKLALVVRTAILIQKEGVGGALLRRIQTDQKSHATKLAYMIFYAALGLMSLAGTDTSKFWLNIWNGMVSLACFCSVGWSAVMLERRADSIERGFNVLLKKSIVVAESNDLGLIEDATIRTDLIKRLVGNKEFEYPEALESFAAGLEC